MQMRQNSTVRKKRVTRPNYGAAARPRARETPRRPFPSRVSSFLWKSSSAPGHVAFPESLKGLRQRRSYHNSDVARRLFHLFRRGASRDAVSLAQRFLAYSGEIRERVGVKIALASGDNALRAFPFDIGAL